MFKVEGKLKDTETYLCICGSEIQRRNIMNHFKTKKHKKFLKNNDDLIIAYTKLSKQDYLDRLDTYTNEILQKKTLSCPIILYFD